MDKQFKQITVEKIKLVDLLNKIGNCDYITIGVEYNHIEGDCLLWISNSEYGEKRIVIGA